MPSWRALFFHLLGLTLLGQRPPLSDDLTATARAACAAPAGARPRLPGITIDTVAGRSGDMPYLRITDRESGGSMNAYYDPSAERVAWARAACLGAHPLAAVRRHGPGA